MMRFFFQTEWMAHWFFDQLGNRPRTMQPIPGGFEIKLTGEK